MIGAEHVEFLPCFHLHRSLKPPNRHRCLILAGQKLEPHVMTHVIHKKEEIAIAAQGRKGD
jgi:hypothetical protein